MGCMSLTTINNPAVIHTQNPQPGACWIDIPGEPIPVGAKFYTEIHVNTVNQEVVAYGFVIEYDSSKIKINTRKGDNVVITGRYGFLSAVNIKQPNVIRISGFDISGSGPDPQLHLLTINWKAVHAGISELKFTVDVLADKHTNDVGTPKGFSSVIEVK